MSVTGTSSDRERPSRVTVSLTAFPTPTSCRIAWGPDSVEFTNFRAQQEHGSAFVVMQFTEPYVGLYNEVIKPVVECEPFKLKARHAGETFGRVILQDIVRGLEEARVVIAEITPANKNVFYELGYAHALKKPTILLTTKDSVNELPFDIKGYRCILYENTIVGKRSVQTELADHLKSILLP
jgi:nucleoside 2-deoxyribosyltransferase